MRALVALMKEMDREPPVKMPPRASRWLRLKRWLGLAPPYQTCVWCPDCGNEMTTCPDTKYYDYFSWLPSSSERDGVVAYICAICSTGSLWDFTPPAPLLLEYTTHGDGELILKRLDGSRP